VALNLAKEERNGSPAPSSPPRPLVTPGSLALAALHSGQLSLSQVWSPSSPPRPLVTPGSLALHSGLLSLSQVWSPSSPPRPLVTPGSLALAALHFGQLFLCQLCPSPFAKGCNQPWLPGLGDPSLLSAVPSQLSLSQVSMECRHL
jgi:hypothetical protein